MTLNENLRENVWYNYPEYDAYLERMRSAYYPGCSGTPHWHDDIEFSLVLSGQLEYNVNGKVMTFHEGEGIFVNSCQLHFGFLQEHTEVDFLCIRLNPMMLYLSPFFENTYILPVTQNHNMPFLRLSKECEWQTKILDSLSELYSLHEKPSAHLQLHGLFCTIWSQLYENMPEAMTAKQSPENDLASMEAMVEFIERHYAEKLTLAQIAEAGHVCQSKCCRLFNKYLHKTPNTYLTHFRLAVAAEQLVTTERSVTEIAFASGFSGASYFAEAFRKCFAITPKEYRAKHRN